MRDASRAQLCCAVPCRAGWAAPAFARGQGGQEQLLQPEGALGVLGCGCLQGMSRAGEVPSQGDVSWGLAFPWTPAPGDMLLSAPHSTMDSRTATSPATGSSSGQRVSARGRVGWGASPGARAPPGLPLSMLMPLPRGDISLECATFPPGSSPSCISPYAGVNTGAVGSYIYDKDPEAKNQP